MIIHLVIKIRSRYTDAKGGEEQGRHDSTTEQHTTQCENGICLKETIENDDFDDLLRVYTESEKKRGVGNLLLEDVDYVIEKSGCNKVKVSITIESVED